MNLHHCVKEWMSKTNPKPENLLSDLALNRKNIHVWSASLLLSIDNIYTYKQMLPKDELERASLFRFEQDRNKYIASKGLTRSILSNHYLEVDANQIEFYYGENGKPYLNEKINPRRIKFNISHSEEIVSIALTIDKKIGIDVEHIRKIHDLNSIVSRFANEDERNWFGRISEERKLEAFYILWTRKEAYIKAVGTGLGQNLSFNVLPSEYYKTNDVLIEGRSIVSGWAFFSSKLHMGYQLSLAVQEENGGLDNYQVKIWDLCIS